MSARAVRRVVLAVCVAGIAGMIVSSITDHNGAVVLFGLITAAAVLCSMVATAVAAGAPGSEGGSAVPDALDGDALGQSIEQRIADLVAAGADEDDVRRLVGDAVRFGRSATGGGGTA